VKYEQTLTQCKQTWTSCAKDSSTENEHNNFGQVWSACTTSGLELELYQSFNTSLLII